MNFYLVTICNKNNEFFLLKTKQALHKARELFILDKFQPDDDYFQSIPCENETLTVEDLFLVEIRSMNELHVSVNDESFPENLIGFVVEVSLESISEQEFNTLQKVCVIHDFD